MSKDENLNYNNLVNTVSNYLFTQKEPMRDEVISLINERPSLKERKSISKRITDKIVQFVETFIDGMG